MGLKRDCIVEFFLSAAEGLAMTVEENRKALEVRQRFGSKGLKRHPLEAKSGIEKGVTDL